MEDRLMKYKKSLQDEITSNESIILETEWNEANHNILIKTEELNQLNKKIIDNISGYVRFKEA